MGVGNGNYNTIGYGIYRFIKRKEKRLRKRIKQVEDY